MIDMDYGWQRTEVAPKYFDPSRIEIDSKDYNIKDGVQDQGRDLVMMQLALCLNLTGNSNGTRLYFRTCMPYCLSECGTILNREYKPIGVGGKSWRNWVDYEAFANTHKLNGYIGPMVWFYHDGNPPWENANYRKDYLYRIIKYFAPSVLHGDTQNDPH